MIAPMPDPPNSAPPLIAIDGPVASGKTAVGRALAERLGWRLFDTGMMYRAATWLALQREVHLDESNSVADLIRSAEIDLIPADQTSPTELDILVDGCNATPELRTPAVESAVPVIAAIAEVRELLVAHQQQLAAHGRLVVVGRDIGTVVLPDAPVKIYLDASPEVRARRRATEMDNDPDIGAVLTNTLRRDQIDGTRKTSPLIAADDAVRIDTSDLTLDQAVDAAERIVRRLLPHLNRSNGSA